MKSGNKLYAVLLIGALAFNANCSKTEDAANPDKKEKASLIESEMVFPDAEWARAEPEDLGFSRGTIDQIGEIMKKNNANGVLIRNGYLVGEWLYGGDADKKFDTQSVGKSITSLLVGLTIDKGLISSLDDPLIKYYPQWECGPYTDEITFRHLLTCTSGIKLRRWTHQRDPGWMKPGLENHYHNDHWTEVATALTYLYKTRLDTVLKRDVMNPIGTEMEWPHIKNVDGFVKTEDGEEVFVVAGYGIIRWSARDLARVGHLYLNKGNWKGRQLISEDYVKESWTEIPQPIGGRRPRPGEDERRAFSPGYGLSWWTAKGTNIWSMLGNGGQFCTVIPKYNIVMAKVNDYNIERRDQLSSAVFLPLVLEAMGEDVSKMREEMREMRSRMQKRRRQEEQN